MIKIKSMIMIKIRTKYYRFCLNVSLTLTCKQKGDDMGSIGATEIIIIVLVLILLFGGKKIPELMKGLGQGIRSFKKSMNEDDSDKSDKSNKE